jgi:Xaa-Pro dipeptidase
MTRPNYQGRVEKLQQIMRENDVSKSLLSDTGSIYYYTGYHSFLYMEFGRPTVVVVPETGEPTIITPTLESEMAEKMSKLQDVIPWLDSVGGEWRTPLKELLAKGPGGKIGIEHNAVPQVVRDFLSGEVGEARIVDVSDYIDDMRSIKDAYEINVARDAGKVAIDMVAAARDTIKVGVPEYEVALATLNAGTRKAAELFANYDDDPLMSPTIRFHQIMSSGPRVSMCHHRSTDRVLQHGDPIFLCFCGHVEFRNFKLGFDRMFFIGDITDEYARMYDLAVESQQAGLSILRPGLTAEEVHQAYADVIRDAGFEFPFRHGRATGYNCQEKPQLMFDDKTILQPGMIFAIDGAVTSHGEARTQVGDAVLVTEESCEVLTPFSKRLEDCIL